MHTYPTNDDKTTCPHVPANLNSSDISTKNHIDSGALSRKKLSSVEMSPSTNQLSSIQITFRHSSTINSMSNQSLTKRKSMANSISSSNGKVTITTRILGNPSTM